MTNKSMIINVVSGKGGTGKTLLVSVLADMLGNVADTKVVVVDLDVFVRGLTSLLYFHQEEKLQLAHSEDYTVSKFFIEKTKSPDIFPANIALAKYRSFDVVPAVNRIDEILAYQDIAPDNVFEAKEIIRSILKHLSGIYNFIILDSRAGFDELIAATHDLSDVSICVEEEDPISRVTTDNLIAQLRVASKTPFFRLVNKARGPYKALDVDTKTIGVTDLGAIPFDMDVMRSFGSSMFWDDISRSLYRAAVARTWNRLSLKMQFGIELRTPRISPVANERLEQHIGLLGSKQRVIFIYGLILGVTGLLYGLFGKEILFALKEDPLRFVSIIVGIMGLLLSFSSVSSRK